MKKTTKAVLLSILLLPGIGHLYLRRYKLGLILLLVSVLSMGAMTVNTVKTGVVIGEELRSENLPVTKAALLHLIEQRTKGLTALSNLSFSLLTLSWIIGVLDSWRVGRIVDAQEREQAKTVH